MKRFLLTLLVCILCISLWGCEPDAPAEESSFPAANFNNQYWFSGDFWAFGQDIFYLQDGFYNMGVYHNAGRDNQKLFEESSLDNGRIGEIFVWDHWLYFELHTDESHMIYRYDLNGDTCAPVCDVPALERWAVVGDDLIYQVHPSISDDGLSPLWICDLSTGAAAQVHPDVTEFGIVDGQLRYITCDDGYTLYQYNRPEDTSTALGRFACEFDRKHSVFNFTPDAVVIRSWARDDDRNLMVYTISSGSTAVHTLPRGIHRLVAYDEYAYAVVYDEKENMSAALPAPENGIYRIRLSDGSWEVVEPDADDETDIHVASDEGIYIIQRRLNLLFLTRRHVYWLDCVSGRKEKLTVI